MADGAAEFGQTIDTDSTTVNPTIRERRLCIQDLALEVDSLCLLIFRLCDFVDRVPATTIHEVTRKGNELTQPNLHSWLRASARLSTFRIHDFGGLEPNLAVGTVAERLVRRSTAAA